MRDPVHPNKVYILNDVSGVSASHDGGDTWDTCASPLGHGAPLNGVVATWGGRADAATALLVVEGERGLTGGALTISVDDCASWSLLHNQSLFSWEYGMAGPVVAAHADTVVVWAAPGPDLGVGTVGVPNFFASVDAGHTWTEITPADPSTSTGILPGPRYAANPTGALVDRTDPKTIWLSFGGRSDALVRFT